MHIFSLTITKICTCCSTSVSRLWMILSFSRSPVWNSSALWLSSVGVQSTSFRRRSMTRTWKSRIGKVSIESIGLKGAAKHNGWHTCLGTQLTRVRFPAFLKFFSGKIIDAAEVNQQRWLEESGRWLENVDRTHLVLPRGKLVVQKTEIPFMSRALIAIVSFLIMRQVTTNDSFCLLVLFN